MKILRGSDVLTVTEYRAVLTTGAASVGESLPSGFYHDTLLALAYFQIRLGGGVYGTDAFVVIRPIAVDGQVQIDATPVDALMLVKSIDVSIVQPSSERSLAQAVIACGNYRKAIDLAARIQTATDGRYVVEGYSRPFPS
jgi:hypothetical protein